MSSLVAGATGIVGEDIALKLAKRGQRVAALVRGGSSYPKAKVLMAAGIEIIEGDLTREETLSKATGKAEAVVCTATSIPSGANDGLPRVDHDGVLALIAAAERQGVKRFVYVSYSGNIREDLRLETAKANVRNA